ncbi:MAG: 23S rRNA (guanosine(2251)-2'-O)-methyltransferase RlmB [Fibrobacterota bacterium]
MAEQEKKQEDNRIYGVHPVKELLRSNAESIDKIYFSDREKRGALFELMKEVKRKKINYANIPAAKLDRMVLRGTNHQGVVAFKTVRPFDDESIIDEILSQEKAPLFLIPAAIEDTGNFGALIRSAAAFGVSALLMERKGSVSLNGTVAKTSAGMIDHMRITKPRNLQARVEQLKDAGVRIIGADGRGDALLSQTDMTGPLCIITGGEHRGIPPYLEKLCTEICAIPMQSSVESLNVSVAAALFLYETQRART